MSRISSQGSHQFAQVPRAEISRSTFNRSCQHKTTFDAGLLVPIFVDEALPGDTFSMSMQGFARLATPLKPVMDNLYLETFWFAIPNRLVWNNWEKFNGQQDSPGDSTDYVIPQITGQAALVTGSIYDYLGIPVTSDGSIQASFSALPLRAYNLVWNEFFRDQNLQNPALEKRDDGPDGASSYSLLRRGKRHDYFTSSLPWPQKGESVSALFPVEGIGAGLGTFDQSNVSVYETKGEGAITQYPFAVEIDPATLPGSYYIEGSAATGGYPQIYADVTINSLRQAFQIQKLLERDARGGTRYTEVIKAHFGVTSPDARLQRPEYLGGGSTAVNISPIAQTSGSAAAGYTDTPQGNLAAIGTASWGGHGFTKSFTEHSIIIGLACVRADLTYQQGLDRMWSRRTRYDFFWPALQHIGEQAVLNKEIYADGTEDDDATWGYQERYAEYRYKPSRVSGLFRSSAAQSLDVWHLAQEFSTRPTLSGTFIQENPPIDRVIAVQDEPHFIVDMAFNLKCARPMPVYGVPGLIDHF